MRSITTWIGQDHAQAICASSSLHNPKHKVKLYKQDTERSETYVLKELRTETAQINSSKEPLSLGINRR